MSDAKPVKPRGGLAPLPYQPAEYELADFSAVQALQRGDATPLQQQRALRWVLEKVCEVGGLGWHPDGGESAAFVAGRRFVGLQILKAIQVNVSALTAKEK